MGLQITAITEYKILGVGEFDDENELHHRISVHESMGAVNGVAPGEAFDFEIIERSPLIFDLAYGNYKNFLSSIRNLSNDYVVRGDQSPFSNLLRAEKDFPSRYGVIGNRACEFLNEDFSSLRIVGDTDFAKNYWALTDIVKAATESNGFLLLH